jgi:hypothetical protein
MVENLEGVRSAVWFLTQTDALKERLRKFANTKEDELGDLDKTALNLELSVMHQHFINIKKLGKPVAALTTSIAELSESLHEVSKHNEEFYQITDDYYKSFRKYVIDHSDAKNIVQNSECALEETPERLAIADKLLVEASNRINAELSGTVEVKDTESLSDKMNQLTDLLFEEASLKRQKRLQYYVDLINEKASD